MFRISLLLWLIAVAAMNLTLLRYSETAIDFSPKFAGLIGLMPLFDFFALSAYVALTRRFRFALVRREVRKRFADSAAVASGAIVASGTLLCLFFPDGVLLLIAMLFSPLDPWVQTSRSSPDTRGFLVGALLGLLTSGPLIVITLILSWVYSRFRLEVTRRSVGGESTER